MNIKNLFDLTGKVALITGGSRGLGLQMAEGLGQMGARVALSARSTDELSSAHEHLRGQGIDSFTAPCDIADAAAVEPMVDRVLKHYGQIDILINCAGIVWRDKAEEHSLEGWNKVMGINVNGTFQVTQMVGRKSMIPRKYGKVIVIGSTQGLRGNRMNGHKGLAYNTSKGALVNFTHGLAGEWGPYNITVNLIAPGLFPSKMTEGIMGQAGERVIAVTPAGRLGGEDDMKGLAVLLSSDASRHITGQIIAVDGGMTAV